MAEPICSSCRHWLTIPTDEAMRTRMQVAIANTMDLIDCDDWLGVCRRYPPAITGPEVSGNERGRDMSLTARRSTWPVTWEDMGCGEHFFRADSTETDATGRRLEASIDAHAKLVASANLPDFLR